MTTTLGFTTSVKAYNRIDTSFQKRILKQTTLQIKVSLKPNSARIR